MDILTFLRWFLVGVLFAFAAGFAWSIGKMYAFDLWTDLRNKRQHSNRNRTT